MSLNDITEKGVDILVNNTERASYEQRANDAEYDLSVSGNDNVKTGVLQTDFRFDKNHNGQVFMDYSLPVEKTGLNGIHTLHVDVKGSYLDTIEVSVNSNTYGNGTHSVSLDDTDSIDVYIYTSEPNTDRTSIVASLIELIGDYNTQTGYSLDGISQNRL